MKRESFVTIFKKSLKEEYFDIKDKDIDDVVDDLIKKANIVNFNEYVRTYKYRNYKNIQNYNKSILYRRYDNKKYQYKCVGELLGHAGQIDRVCFDNSSEFFFTASTDGMIKLWNILTGHLVYSFIAHRSLVNDLCFSKDGKLMASCDFFGTLNIWSLEAKKVLFNFQFHIGVDFTEFLVTDGDVYRLVVILSTGLIKTYKFNKEKVLEIQENDIHANEAVKAICITDGGRFLLRGGYWPYLLVLDTLRPCECIIFETDGLSVHTLCASKDNLKFAAACANYIFQWTFSVDGNPSHGNFVKSNKDLRGFWSKKIVQVDPHETFNTERMCYLRDDYLVCVCSDLKIRIYTGTTLKSTFDISEIGVVCPHPFDNVFALCGSSIDFYSVDEHIFSISINFNVTDCQFSNDGNYFVVGDDFGKTRVFSLLREKFEITEQFFPSDLDHINSLNENITMDCDNSKVLDINRNVNPLWRPSEYSINSIYNRSNLITEEFALVHLSKSYLDKDKYNKKYGVLTVSESNVNEEEEELSSSSFTSDSEYDSSESESKEHGLGIQLRRDLIEQPRYNRRRIVVDESSEEKESFLIKKLRRNRSLVESEEENSSHNESVFVKKLRRSRVTDTPAPVEANESVLVQKLRRNRSPVVPLEEEESEEKTVFRRLRRHQRDNV